MLKTFCVCDRCGAVAAPITVGGVEYVLEAGETLIMPKGIPHAVFGLKRFKMLLTVSF